MKVFIISVLLFCTQQTLANIQPHKKIPLRKVPFEQIINETEKQYGLPENVLSALIEHESSFNEKAINPVSRYNAVTSYGLGQITLPTARGFCGIKNKKNLINASTNIRCTAKILKSHIEQYGGINPALAAYRAGTPCNQYHTRTVRKCSQADKEYVNNILKKLRRIRDRNRLLVKDI